MPRIRSIHPEACESEKLLRLSDGAERTMWRLTTHSDDEGRGVDNPKLLASRLYPLDDDKTDEIIDGHLWELVEAGMLVRYEIDGKRYYQIHDFGDWQKPRHRTESKFPGPSDGDTRTPPEEPASYAHVGRVSDVCPTPAAEQHHGVGGGGGEGDGDGDPSGGDGPAWRQAVVAARQQLNGKASYDLLGVYRAAGKQLLDAGSDPPVLIPLVVDYVEQLLGQRIDAKQRAMVAKTVRRNGLVALAGWDKALGATEADGPRERLAYAQGVVNRIIEEGTRGN